MSIYSMFEFGIANESKVKVTYSNSTSNYKISYLIISLFSITIIEVISFCHELLLQIIKDNLKELLVRYYFITYFATFNHYLRPVTSFSHAIK